MTSPSTPSAADSDELGHSGRCARTEAAEDCQRRLIAPQLVGFQCFDQGRDGSRADLHKCHFRHFGEGVAPPPRGYTDDPLCVDYAKRDITVDNGGAVRFAAAEPARFAIAVRACRYWQVDHWSVQLDRGFTAIVRWDGSYWYDRGRGIGGVLMRNFRVAGQPSGAQP